MLSKVWGGLFLKMNLGTKTPILLTHQQHTPPGFLFTRGILKSLVFLLLKYCLKKMDYDTNKNIGQKHENKTNSLACTQSSINFSGVFLNY